MADANYVFARSIFFNPEMRDKYKDNIERYTNYFTIIIRNIDVYLQKDQLMHTHCRFPLVPVPTYLPNSYEVGQSDVCHIKDAVYSETREVEHEKLVIMEEQQNKNQHDLSNASMHSSFSRLHSFKLNDMGYSLNRISPITFGGDAFQTPNNRTQGRAPMSTPRKIGKEAHLQANPQGPPMNKTFPVNQAPRQEDQPRSKSYDAETSVRCTVAPD